MKRYEKLKIVMVGAGSCSFCPVTLGDILLSESIHTVPLTVSLMDIDSHALEVSREYAERPSPFRAGRSPWRPPPIWIRR